MTGRGVAVVFRGTSEGLPLGTWLAVHVGGPEGEVFKGRGTVELPLRRAMPPIERAALVVEGIPAARFLPGARFAIGV